MGMADEGEELVASLEEDIADAVGEYPQLEGKATMFLTHVDTTDLSEVSFYTPFDTRSAFFEDLGLSTPASVAEASTDPEQFSGTVSAEQVDVFDDVDIIVTYGDQALVDALNADPLLSQIPAVAERRDRPAARHPAGHGGEPDPAGHLLGARRLRHHARRGS